MKCLITKYIVLIVFFSAVISCSRYLEKKLLENKIYFDKEYQEVLVEGVNEITTEITAKSSKKVKDDTPFSLDVVVSLVEEYNKRYSTDYIAIDPRNVEIAKETKLQGGTNTSTACAIKLSNLSELKEGKRYMLPIRVSSTYLANMSGANIKYLIVKKPIKILKAWDISNGYIYVPLNREKEYTSLTYEALVRVNYFGGNNTVMGTEGTLILRIGDIGGGLASEKLQIAGNKQFHYDQKLAAQKWYHLAFTYDANTGKAKLIVNGDVVAESTWAGSTFKLGDGVMFYIGKIGNPTFLWGDRPLSGQMSEVRVWTVARTESQLKQNMYSIDPTTEGLEFYYKLDGTDTYEKNGEYFVKDQTAHGLDGHANGKASPLNIKTLTEAIKVN